MKAVITGATGFIGTALCEEMLKNGHEVTAVIRPGSEKRKKLCFSAALNTHLEVVEAALEDFKGLGDQIGKADVFYHLAWNGTSGAAREDFDIQQANIGYMANAVRAAVKCGCRKFVGAGSQAEYGVVHGIAREDRKSVV